MNPFTIIKWIFGAVVSPITNLIGKFVDASVQKHISDNVLSGTAINAVANADGENARTRRAEGAWSPWVIVTIFGFMVPAAFHFWQVVLDSSKWHVRLGAYYLPELVKVRDKVLALPGLFEATEHAIIQSLFVGASAGLAVMMSLKAWKAR